MINRVAFFAEKNDIENFFGIDIRQEHNFEAHYNMPPGWQLPVVYHSDEKGAADATRVPWGNTENATSSHTQLHTNELADSKTIKESKRCILVLSGFYIWKDPESKGHPFFVRMLNHPFMAIAGFWVNKGDQRFTTMVTIDSNPLIQPMSAHMPLLLNRETAGLWLDDNQKTETVIAQSESLYLLTDLSVMRVSKKVNDLSNNNPKMIQPIPK